GDRGCALLGVPGGGGDGGGWVPTTVCGVLGAGRAGRAGGGVMPGANLERVAAELRTTGVIWSVSPTGWLHAYGPEEQPAIRIAELRGHRLFLDREAALACAAKRWRAS
ncbi:MAG TPA: hypothetical protein VD948_03940, partial [Rhodothermales bacterium]|nr:hypothetical protein [Rhodothermales bacterium]